MPPVQKYRLGDVLVDQGLISFSELTAALKKQKFDKQRIGKTLVDMKVVEERDVVGALARQAVYNKQVDPTPKPYEPEAAPPLPLFERLMRAALVFGLITLLYIIFLAVNGTSTAIHYSDAKPTIAKLTTTSTAKMAPVSTAAATTFKATNTNATEAELTNGGEAGVISMETAVSTASISKIDVYESALQQQFIFHSSESLVDTVNRRYLADNWVSYQFKGVNLAAGTSLKTSDDWVRNNSIKQRETGVEWKFQLRNAGSAKFHELQPEQGANTFRLVVVIRDTGSSSNASTLPTGFSQIRP